MPGLSYHLILLWLSTDASNCYTVTSAGIKKTFLKSDELFSTNTGQLNGLYGHRTY